MKDQRQLEPGQRIELLEMKDDPDAIAAGTKGTIIGLNHYDGWSQVDVDWETGRTLMLTIPPDKVRVIG